jgi:chromosomal replication initiation ATPase DnaA
MQKKSEQLVLDLPHREALGRDDFLVTSSNAAAVELIDQWPNWPSHAAIILGSEGSGKTHLLEVWRQRSGAPLAIASDLVTTEIPILLKDGVAAIEDIHANNINERALFHALNLAKQEGKHILITSRLTPGE